jgi:hypothetical protein
LKRDVKEEDQGVEAGSCVDRAVCIKLIRLDPKSFLWSSVMSSAIELIVDGYARLSDRQSLEELRMHRHRLAGELKARAGFDCTLSIAQIEQDIAAIEAGLETLSGPVGG